MKKLLLLICIVILVGGGLYWYFWQQRPMIDDAGNIVLRTGTSPFSPFNRSGDVETAPTTTPEPGEDEPFPVEDAAPQSLPKLRQLSTTPVAGVAASSTATTSVIYFIDRGNGHVYEATTASAEIRKISNTTLPKIYESSWNKNLTSFISRYLREDGIVTNFYAEVRPVTGTSTDETPFEIKGSYLSANIENIAVSPQGDRIFTWNMENGVGNGYLSSFNEKNRTKIVELPLQQVVIDWPSSEIVTVNTKASATASGFLYFIGSKTGTVKKALGNIRGLVSRTSKDGSKTLYSSTSGSSILLSLLNNKDSSAQEVVFRTLAEKCVWSSLRTTEVYCAVPTEIPNGTYPDDWYKGTISFTDQIWYLDTTTGEVHLLANLLTLSNKLIDATHLTLDPKEDTLTFINKRDLSLWMLDLNQ